MSTNLAKAIKAIRKNPKALTDDMLAQLTLDLILDAPDDENGSAARLKVKLDAIALIHQMNKDNKPKESTDGGSNNTDDIAGWKPTAK